MTLNDAHIFCRPEQLKSEFKRVVELIQHVYRDFGIEDYYFRLSYRDPEDTEKYVQKRRHVGKGPDDTERDDG